MGSSEFGHVFDGPAFLHRLVLIIIMLIIFTTNRFVVFIQILYGKEFYVCCMYVMFYFVFLIKKHQFLFAFETGEVRC